MFDVYDMWKQHEAEQEAWLEKRPKCEFCGESIQDEYLFDVGGDIYCEDCMKDAFRRDADNYER